MQSPAKFCPHYVIVSLLLLNVATIHMRGKQCKKLVLGVRRHMKQSTKARRGRGKWEEGEEE